MPVVAYVDPDSIHNPTSGGIAPATWFTTHESNFRSLVGRVGCQRIATTAQVLTTPGSEVVDLGTVDWNNGMTTGAVANAITVPASYGGRYLISARMRVDSAPSGANSVTLDVLNNGGSIWRELCNRSGASGGLNLIAVSFIYALAVGDDLTLSVTCDAGATSPDTELTNVIPALSAIWLSA